MRELLSRPLQELCRAFVQGWLPILPPTTEPCPHSGDSPVTALTVQDLILLEVALVPLRSSGWADSYFKALNTSFDSHFSTPLLSGCSHSVRKVGRDKEFHWARKVIQSLLPPKNPTKIKLNKSRGMTFPAPLSKQSRTTNAFYSLSY